ncbi:MAG: hypothetical protein JEZ03_12205 [Bacteroidales bacterium]|nr:hypothetical protein [Bacteroidales bacterium]
MKKIYLFFTLLLITGISFEKISLDPIDDGSPNDYDKSSINVNSENSNSIRAVTSSDYFNTPCIGISHPHNTIARKQPQLLFLTGDISQPSPSPADSSVTKIFLGSKNLIL